MDAEAFRGAFRSHASSVVVITTSLGGLPVGFTATSLTSVASDPPTASFVIGATASSWPAIERSRVATINFLDRGQAEVAQRFATSGIDRFEDPVRWHWSRIGAPVLSDVPARMTLDLQERIPVGEQFIVTGTITGVEQLADFSSLIYRDGAYEA